MRTPHAPHAVRARRRPQAGRQETERHLGTCGRASLSSVAALAAATLVGGGAFTIAMVWPYGLSALYDFLFGTTGRQPDVFSAAFVLPAIATAFVALVLAVPAAKQRIETSLRTRYTIAVQRNHEE